MKKVLTIGGGTGHSQVLKALKGIAEISITGICPSTDSGGSTRILHTEYGGGSYVGDVTKCISALCADGAFAKALLFRYEGGPLQGHSVKNLLFHALEKGEGPDRALETMWKICGLGFHRIFPVTYERTELCATLQIGDTVTGETNIDTIAKNPLWNPSVHSIKDVYLKPHVKATSVVIDAVADSDYIIICPGDLYSSVIPVLLPEGIKESIASSRAKIVVILNIMTKKGETDNYTAKEFIERIEERLGRRADFIIGNNSVLPDDILARYSLEQKVELESFVGTNDPRILQAPLALITKENQILTSPDVLTGVLCGILTSDSSV